MTIIPISSLTPIFGQAMGPLLHGALKTSYVPPTISVKDDAGTTQYDLQGDDGKVARYRNGDCNGNGRVHLWRD